MAEARKEVVNNWWPFYAINIPASKSTKCGNGVLGEIEELTVNGLYPTSISRTHIVKL
jgi:hypothetical protein